MKISGRHCHRGDCFWGAVMLSRVPGEHQLYVPTEYVVEFAELLDGLPIKVDSIDNEPPDAKNIWIANGRFDHRGISYFHGECAPLDIMGFVQSYFNAHCEEEGLPPCFPNREDMLHEFPACRAGCVQRDGILVVNAHPRSGQVANFNGHDLDMLISRLGERNTVVVTNTTELNGLWVGPYTLAEIGRLSCLAKAVVGVATGPIWPTLSAFNRDIPFVVELDPMELRYGALDIRTGKNVPEMLRHCEDLGLL